VKAAVKRWHHQSGCGVRNGVSSRGEMMTAAASAKTIEESDASALSVAAS